MQARCESWLSTISALAACCFVPRRRNRRPPSKRPHPPRPPSHCSPHAPTKAHQPAFLPDGM